MAADNPGSFGTPPARTSSTSAYDVVIAGAGPVGLLLACELAVSHVAVLVLEQAQDTSSPFKAMPLGMRGLNLASIEALDRRGLLDRVSIATDTFLPKLGQGKAPGGRPAGHFAGIQFDRSHVDTSKWRYRLDTPANPLMMTVLERVETALSEHAATLGIEIRRGLGVHDFEQSDDGVTVRAGDQTFRAKWLVGCDGGRSTVRKAGGFEFVGTDPEFTGYSALVEMADPQKLPPGRNYTSGGMYSYSMWQSGHLIMADFDGGKFHRSEPFTMEHMQAVLRRLSGTDATITSMKLGSTWTDRSQQVATYRKGRVLLAGDAAHIHSPLGGQGLNLGIGDALNLGWKLAATIRGWAPEGLIDTYQAERYPIGERVLEWSRAQVAVMKATQESRALKAIVSDILATDDGATYFAERVWGLSSRYDLGGGDSEDSIVGRSVPNFKLLGTGPPLTSLLRSGKGILLDFGPRAELREVSGQWDDRVDYVARGAENQLGLTAVLIRPDGAVAWVCGDELNVENLANAMLRWFGAKKA